MGKRDGGGRTVYKGRHICGGGMVPQGFQGGMGTPEMTLVLYFYSQRVFQNIAIADCAFKCCYYKI